MVSPYQGYLVHQWNQGRHRVSDLFKDLQHQGYTGSYMSLTRYVRRLRQSQLELEKTSVLPSTPRTVLPQRQTLTARRASYLILENPQTRRADDEQLRRRLIDLPSDANPSH